MAHTAHSENEDVTEYFDKEDVLEEKLDRLAELVRRSKFFVAFTGAGISTSAGIPDFRGPQVILEYQPRTLKAKGEKPTGASVPKGRAKPTFTHMALKSLMDEGMLRFLVSQNCDGLHLKSGIDPGLIAELHGNTNVEMCPECGRKYYRASGVKNKKKYPPKGRNKSKLTGRLCEEVGCDGKLRYTTVSFNQSMPDECLGKAEKFSRRSDLSLCLGTSMRVTPACDLPTMGADKHRGGHALVIVNLQTTPYDDVCALRLFARVDVVMAGLCERLKIPVRECVKLSLTEDDRWTSKFSETYLFRSAPDSSWFNHAVGDVRVGLSGERPAVPCMQPTMEAEDDFGEFEMEDELMESLQRVSQSISFRLLDEPGRSTAARDSDAKGEDEKADGADVGESARAEGHLQEIIAEMFGLEMDAIMAKGKLKNRKLPDALRKLLAEANMKFATEDFEGAVATLRGRTVFWMFTITMGSVWQLVVQFCVLCT